MSLLTLSYTRLSQQHRAQEILQQENLFDDSSGSKLLKPPAMSSSGKASNAKLLAALQQKSDQAEKELALAQERERCRSIPLDQLGVEKVTAGKAKDQTVKAACEDAKYLKWLLLHQADNINFVNLLIFSERSLLTTTEQNSGDVPTGKDKNNAHSEMNDWEHVIGSDRQRPDVRRDQRDVGSAEASRFPTGRDQQPAGADDIPRAVTTEQPRGKVREPQSAPERTRAGGSAEVSRGRSRSPFPSAGQQSSPSHACAVTSLEPVPEEAVCVADVEGDDPGSPEESVGNLEDGMRDGKPLRGNRIAPQLANLGCFAWQELNTSASEWEPVPVNQGFHVTEANRGSELDFENLFVNALNAKQEVFEITMDIQPRDVHKVTVGGKPNWILNEKPKKRAEVQFRALSDDDKVGFLKAMQGELRSYLDHEAVEIAKRHGIPASRILGMRWVLTWKAATDESTGAVTSHKPKARLISKGFQDPDLLHLKRDSPTLATQSRNMILALSAANNWRCFLGDIKTAFLNGDKTEAQREIYAEPPEEVKRMLNMRINEEHGPTSWQANSKLRDGYSPN